MHSPLDPPVLEDVRAARRVIEPHLPPTPLVRSARLSDRLGCDYYIKAESLQPVGAFKVRGGVNLVASLGEKERRAGLVTASTGNHGQSIAYAARLFGARVVIYVPAENANPLKIAAMERLGAEVRPHGRDFDEAREACQREAEREGFRYVHSANEPLLLAGVATMALEILDALPDPDVVLVPVGGGSGAAGVSIVMSALCPKAAVIGVQSEAAPALARAWQEGHLEPHPRMETVHEGLATRVPFELTMRVMRGGLSDFRLLSDEAISRAVVVLAEEAGLVAEGAGAATLAAALELREELSGKRVVGILSGGNITRGRLARILDTG